jgi:hypothetical protein
MDEERVTPFSFDGLSAMAAAVSLAFHIAAGILLGLLYFRSVRWSADRFAGGGRTVTTIAVTIGRLVVLGGLLTCASLEGALPLLTMTFGILIARPMVMHRARIGIP